MANKRKIYILSESSGCYTFTFSTRKKAEKALTSLANFVCNNFGLQDCDKFVTNDYIVFSDKGECHVRRHTLQVIEYTVNSFDSMFSSYDN